MNNDILGNLCNTSKDADTSSPTVTISLKDIHKLSAIDTSLIADLQNGEKLLFLRNDYENLARKNGWINKETIVSDPEILPLYPGGRKEWIRFLSENVQYPAEAMDSIIEGKVALRFLVNKEGEISEVEVIEAPEKGGIREEAVRVLKASGKWHPGIHQSNLVSSYNRISITFRLEKQEAEFPGGDRAWTTFLSRTVRYPSQAIRSRIDGTVVAQFIIEKDGSVTDIKTISGPLHGGLREEVVRIIKNSGKWIPGSVNGVPIRSYKKQPITFKLGRF